MKKRQRVESRWERVKIRDKDTEGTGFFFLLCVILPEQAMTQLMTFYHLLCPSIAARHFCLQYLFCIYNNTNTLF